MDFIQELGPVEWAMVFVVLVIIFGARKIPQLGAALGAAIRTTASGQGTTANAYQGNTIRSSVALRSWRLSGPFEHGGVVECAFLMGIWWTFAIPLIVVSFLKLSGEQVNVADFFQLEFLQYITIPGALYGAFLTHRIAEVTFADLDDFRYRLLTAAKKNRFRLQSESPSQWVLTIIDAQILTSGPLKVLFFPVNVFQIDVTISGSRATISGPYLWLTNTVKATVA